MKLLIGLFLFTALSSAYAAQLNCTRDDEADDWSITGELGASELNLFDNDSNATFKLKMVLESLPSILVYQEVGNPSNKIEVQASMDGRSAKATYFSTEDEVAKVLFTCSLTE